MKKLLLILLFPLFLFSQVSTSTWNNVVTNHDDILHVYGSLGIMIVASEITYHYTHNINKSIVIGAGTSLFIGVVGKELIYDKWLKKGTYNVTDIFYDMWGNIIAIIVERCWMDWRGFDKVQYEQDYFDSQIRTRKHKKKRWSFKNTGLLK
jgi:predicted Na+-dependent transporter